MDGVSAPVVLKVLAAEVPCATDVLEDFDMNDVHRGRVRVMVPMECSVSAIELSDEDETGPSRIVLRPLATGTVERTS